MVGVIGVGKMGEAIVAGLVRKGIKNIFVFDTAEDRLDYVSSTYLVKSCRSSCEVVEKSRITFIAVKPQNANDVFDSVKGCINKDKIIVSVMAGVGGSKIIDALGLDRVVRVMPNTPSLIGEGMVVVSFIGRFEEEEKKELRDLVGVLGDVIELDERYMDAVTAVSGSGPAYVFLFIESLVDAGVRIGLGRDVALKLVIKTISGSVKLLEHGNARNPRELIDMVTSPGGTTISALHVLERGAFKGIIMDAIEAAFRRSIELGR